METDGPTLDCSTVRAELGDLRRGRLEPHRRDAVMLHLRGCATCSREDREEALLDRLLSESLPVQVAPSDLRQRIAALCAEADGDARSAAVERSQRAPAEFRRRAWSTRTGVAAVAAAAVLVVGVAVLQHGTARRGTDPAVKLTREAIADHLRVVTALHPLDVDSDDSHNVKPWFEGRLDFAPNVPGAVGALRLRGASVGYFLDRKAAVISYALRKHAVTLLAFSASDLAWPAPTQTLDGVPVHASTEQGVHVVLWRHGGIGYAAVADVAPAEFMGIAGQLARATAD